MNAGILAPGYAPPVMPRPLLGQPQTVPTPYGRSGDPYWDNVSLYLRMDGPHGSLTFTDVSKNRFTVTANGDAQISGQRGRFAATSGLFDGNGDWAEIAANTLFSFGTSDWTAECWFFIAGNSSVNNGATRDACLFAVAAQPSVSFSLVISGSASTTGTAFQYYQNVPSLVNVVRTVTIPQQQWHHVAVVRLANVVSIYFNGARVGATASVTAASGDSTRPFSFGRLGNVTGFLDHLNGNISEFRLTRNVARYTSNFPPPTAPFPVGYQ